MAGVLVVRRMAGVFQMSGAVRNAGMVCMSAAPAVGRLIDSARVLCWIV
ncbi:MAG TPA: hypothetical protein VL383_14405 [Gemmatimonadaceae bacterium]|jgi:hypothetical protein|nr:hypothetical protein [Gemmatimonadaceae bacterium]